MGVLIAVAALIVWIWWGNTALEVNQYEVSSNRIPKAFNGFRIAQVSDLHNAQFGKSNGELIEQLCQTNADLIVLTGDLVDSRVTDIQVALDFATEAVKIAPVYYVPGNHEARIAQYGDLKIGLEKIGVIVLENEAVPIIREGACITILGVIDPSFETDYLLGDAEQVISSKLSAILNKTEGYRILLSHRPELFGIYIAAGMDLVFSGHAHGGQIRLPFFGGLIAPNQGFFPKYDAGLFIQGETKMIVSRGAGNSIIPVRILNRPEIVAVQLSHPSDE